MDHKYPLHRRLRGIRRPPVVGEMGNESHAMQEFGSTRSSWHRSLGRMENEVESPKGAEWGHRG